VLSEWRDPTPGRYVYALRLEQPGRDTRYNLLEATNSKPVSWRRRVGPVEPGDETQVLVRGLLPRAAAPRELECPPDLIEARKLSRQTAASFVVLALTSQTR